MKTLSLFLLLLGVSFNQTVQAEPAIISYLHCRTAGPGLSGLGVTYTGLDYFNVFGTNAFGFPFTEQAKIVDANMDGSTMTFKLKGMVTGTNFTLGLINRTNQGWISAGAGDLDLTCAGQIDIQN